MSIPNILTVLRLILVPVFAVVFHFEGEAKVASAIIFMVASITDVLDGYIARKFNMSTKIGQLLDPLADKLMQLTAIVCLTLSGRLPLWFIIILAIKEILLIAGCTFLYIKKTYAKSNIFGKLYTVVLFVALMLLMAVPEFSTLFELLLLLIVVGIGIFALSAYCYSYFLQHKKFKQYIKKGENL
ncbi:MAG: CDP-diacylglycerol--glycerol-3-phosphate 3-phosphatidyltransferase [Clostridia bacterium]|nr:CDP-diacylglycerol--glycerol-3-phosphate 3-phosphatidyltransferase [Clostridia bacterium]